MQGHLCYSRSQTVVLPVLESKFLTFSKFRKGKIFVVSILASWSFMRNMRNFAPYENFPPYDSIIENDTYRNKVICANKFLGTRGQAYVMLMLLHSNR